MRKTFIFAVIVEGLLVAAGSAQGLPDQLNFSRSNTEGFHFYGVSAFGAYSSYNFLPRPIATQVDTRSQYGGGTTVGWQHFRDKLNAVARYSINYDGTIQHSTLNRFNQSFLFDLTRSFGPKWSVSLSANGQDMSLSQSLFELTSLGAVSQSATSFNDLSAAMSVGQFSNSQSAVMLGGSSAGFSPTVNVLLGSRVLSYAAHVAASYEYSSRLSFQFGSFAIGGKRRNDIFEGSANNYVMPRTVGGTASVAMTYSLSPRTSLGLSVSENFTSSTYQRATSTNASASLGRKMGKNWFLSVNAGGAFTQNLNQAVGAAPQQQMTWGGSLGYRTRSHTFVGRYLRSGYDATTAVLGTNTNMSAAWSWRPVRSSWGLHASYTRNETGNTGFSSLYGWQMRTGISRALSRQMTLLIDGSYLRSHGLYSGLRNEVSVHAIRISLGWTPGLTRRSSAPMDDEEVK